LPWKAREAFLQAGGKEFHYIPCLNDDPAWITAMCELDAAASGGLANSNKPPTRKILQTHDKRH
jgi:hypothetical protein